MYLDTHFELKYPSIDLMMSCLNALGPAAKKFKIDISRAFRHVRIDPGDIDLLGLRFRDQYFADWASHLDFAWVNFFFKTQRLNYIDNHLYCGLPSKIHSACEFLLQLLHELGLDINAKKLHPPDTQVVCFSILFDTFNRTFSTPPEKLQKIIQN